MKQPNQLSNLAKYYRELLFSLFSQAGKHFIDINAVLRYGLTADLSLFIPEIEELITNGIISFKIEKASSDEVDKIVETANEIEDQEEQKQGQRGLFENTNDAEFNLEEYEKRKASAILVAIYRRQQFDPYNREVIIGFPLVSGKIGKKKFCAPLFYYKVRIEFDPQKNIITLLKDFEIPALNFQLIKYLIESDEDIEIIRQQILPHLHREDFELSSIKEIIKILSELVEGFKGIAYSSQPTNLKTALESRESDGAKIFNASIIVNAKRTSAYLIDDLTQLSQIEKIDGESVIDTILSMPVEDENNREVEDPVTCTQMPPLLFPLLSNMSQRLAAVKAEKARLLVIQGPPGTGKSQTIVNLICHLVANGKTVLVSSHQNKALEVITKAMPQVNYLAMSLLKGEKESINELTNKIEGFHSHVSSGDVNHLNQLLKNRWTELERLDDNIKRLQVRFSELKILERDRYSTYYQYHKIRDYDLIDPSDSIPEGIESSVAPALSEFGKLLQRLKEHYSDIEKILPSKDDSIEATIECIRYLISAYDWIKENLSSDKHELLSFCQQCSQTNHDLEECIKSLHLLIKWVNKYCWSLISALKILSEAYNLDLDFQTVKKNAIKYETVIGDIVGCAENLVLKLHTLREQRVEAGYPEYPDNSALEESAFNLEILNNSKDSWWKWHLSMKARSARKFFVSQKLPKPVYKKQDDVLKKLKAWKDHWALRNQIVRDLKYLIEMGIPIKELPPQPSIGELHHNANLAQKYVHAISALNEFPSIQFDTIKEIIESRVAKISKYEEIALFKECIEQTITYLESINKLRKLKSNNHFANLCKSIFAPIEKAIFQLTHNKQADKTIAKLKELYPFFYDYKKLKTYEQNQLKTLIKTCINLREKVFRGEDVPELEKPELVIEAFRLSSFIKDDLLKNPDDINEIAKKINTLKEESRQKILKILDASRRLALKKAESNRETLFLINKLKQILKRKRKTHSFVQLRDQIDYSRLLSVFPCWIMSIEDVARIFPLQAGLFDYLIVDEASQCNQATALHLAYRAKRMIVVGDSKQMKNPNTQFLSDAVVQLNLTKHKLDNHPRAAFLHGRNSLLDLAIGCQDISPVFLNEHFRCEPPIIEFSNRHFYNNNLKVLTPFRRRRFTPCMEIRIINGAYDDPENTKQNIIEAKAVIAELKRMLDNGELIGDKKDEKLTVGILSPFRHQASLLQGMMYKMFEDRPHLLKDHEMIASTVDGFQGDERDVILYSFRYAANSKPGTIQALQKNDEHSLGRLNVAFSRARRRVICFISLPKDNFPKGLIKDYLNHVLSIQNNKNSRLGNPNEKEKCQSDFEKNVFDNLVKNDLEVYAQVPCAGFFIDFVVIDKEGRRMAIECDGEFHYEDGELREEDYQRQDIIERYGWFVHRISSRRYYANPQKAIACLLADLANQKIDEEIIGSDVQKEDDLKEPIKDSLIEEYKNKESYYETASTIEDRIVEILSEQGPMPLWKIAQVLGKPKDEMISLLKKLLEQKWVINYIENGVKLWKAID